MRLVRVAVPVPALPALTYGLPEGFPAPATGARVLVPLGNRVLTGCVFPDEAPQNGDGDARVAVKPLIDILDSEPFLPSDVVALAAWVAEYYACGAGEAMAAAMPPRAWIESERFAQITGAGLDRLGQEGGRRGELLKALAGGAPARVETLVKTARAAHGALLALERDGLIAFTQPLRGRASAHRTVRVARLTTQGLDVAGTPGEGVRLGPKQQTALDLLAGSPDGMDTPALQDRGVAPDTLVRLARLGLVAFERRTVERDPFEQEYRTTGERLAVTLTAEQDAAFRQLASAADAGSFRAIVLHGVTGSGKTELYLRLADRIRRSGRGAILLVPEIALTPAAARIFRAAFGDRVAIQHSGLSEGERHDQWHRIRRGAVDVVVGTRSAVFAPVHRLGLIVVDEEHDTSYKQEESPRYHGRDVAVMRGRNAEALVVLGSATPSLETFHNARSGRYEIVTLSSRVLDRPLATVRTVDMREAYAAAGPDVVLSAELCHALGERLDRGEQAMVLLNRRGFATAVFCRQCAATLECPNCSVTLTVHRAARRARCHYCNYSMALPKACTTCGGTFLEQTGFGTERVEAEVRERFPRARVARVDRDTIRRRGAIAALLGSFAAGELDVLVGTQMIAKGHDFPRVSLVGVISADVGLGLADFRAGERTFQLLTQVAGRAGRGEIAGHAIVQTLYPGHYSIRHACRQDYAAFYEEEVAFRRAMRYPPAVALINVIVRGRTPAAAMHDAGELAAALRRGAEPYRVLGPAPAPLSRIKGEHRAQLFIKGTHRTAMRRALLAALKDRGDLRKRTVIDVDPMSVL